MGTSTTRKMENITSDDSPPVLACLIHNFIFRRGTLTFSSSICILWNTTQLLCTVRALFTQALGTSKISSTTLEPGGGLWVV